MGIPYARTVTLEVEAGEESFHRIGYPHRGELKRFVVTQIEGSAVGFDVDLHSSKDVIPPGSSSSASGSGTGGPGNVVIATQTAAPGADINLQDQKISYFNADGTPTNPQRYLYLRIEPTGSGTVKFDVTIASEQPVL